MAKVSVIMPSLNVAKYIEGSVESVVNQTLKDIEIICVDAGSDDGTWEILQEYAEKDDRIVLIKSDMKSYGYQMNLGMEIASGEYIGIVETDDYIEAEMYENLYQKAVEADADIVKSDFEMFTEKKNGHIIRACHSLGFFNGMPYDQVFSCKSFFDGTVKLECYIWDAIYKRNFIRENRVRFNETPGASFQDFGFRYQTNFFAKRIVAVPKAYYKYRRSNMTASTYSSRTQEYNLRESLYMMGRLEQNEDTDAALMAAMAKEIVEYALGAYYELLVWNEPADTTMGALEGYRPLLKRIVETGLVTRKDIPYDLWRDLNLLIEDATLFDRFIRVVARLSRESVLEELQYIRANNEVVVFGTGLRGKSVYAFLENNGIDIRAFCDNNPGTMEEYDRVSVISPQNAVEMYPDGLYIISSMKYKDAMTDQLVELGVSKDRIHVYPLRVDPLFCTNCLIEKVTDKKKESDKENV